MSLKDFRNPVELRKNQYATSVNLNARANLHENHSTNRVPWFRWYFDQIRVPSGISMFEIGCGPGHFWRQNDDRIPASIYHLSDHSIGMVKETRAY